ncbi:hypothetical protein B0T17DRAFT_506521 [Bombardia bombarda]|uniref:Uncharacterized protein n=1 Tax=Bombardia bombarda TaxID=252184 RepID=A0AA39XB55_9PEZI|nr:hypothetical protein B0T17DRAFT_506521 [Bombardia bombarda]
MGDLWRGWAVSEAQVGRGLIGMPQRHGLGKGTDPSATACTGFNAGKFAGCCATTFGGQQGPGRMTPLAASVAQDWRDGWAVAVVPPRAWVSTCVLAPPGRPPQLYTCSAKPPLSAAGGGPEVFAVCLNEVRAMAHAAWRTRRAGGDEGELGGRGRLEDGQKAQKGPGC